MDERWHEEHDRLGPVRPRRPSQSLDYVGPSPQASPRPSTDLPYRFRSRRSMAKTRGASQLSQQLSPGASPSFRYSGETPTNGSERKASFRRAVRKLFGKKAGDQVSASQSSRSPPSHNYHRSDPGQLVAHIQTQTPPAPPPGASALPLRQHPPGPLPPLNPRVVSAPFRHDDFSPVRVRSPNAMQFSKSAQLKPLDLANPFYHKANHEPKRRATLPTLDLATRDTDGIGTALGSPPDSGMAGMDLSIPGSEIGLAVTTLADKRRSRSANDLSLVMVQQSPKQRRRSSEIRFWRESFAGSVLLHPNTPPEEPAEIDPLDGHSDGDGAGAHAGPSVGLEGSARSVSSTSASDAKASSAVFVAPRPATAGPGRSDDIERRVTELEASLQRFQHSLDRLTVVSRANSLSPALQTQRTRRQQHTPSVLVHTLQNPSWRPESLDDDFRDPQYEDAGEVLEREWGGSGTHSPHDRQRVQSKTPSDGTIRQGGFTALYNMLSDERAARNKLETEMYNLQREVTSMATRLERGSWSSYHVPPLPVHHRPRTPEESVRGVSSHSAYDPRVVSRFSGSESVAESEIYGLNSSRLGHRPVLQDEDLATPSYDMFRTPLEGNGPYGNFRDSEMF